MPRLPVWALLPVFLLAACQSGGQPAGKTSATATQGPRPCTSRMQDAGQCNVGSVPVFSELTNIR